MGDSLLQVGGFKYSKFLLTFGRLIFYYICNMKLFFRYGFLSILVVYISSCNTIGTNSELNQQQLLDSILKLNIQVDSISKTTLTSGGEMEYWQHEYNPNFSKLKNQGINTPKVYIIDNLMRQNNLIPMKAVLGGNMQFSRVSLLGKSWAIADFNDGHVGGEMLLNYSVKDTSIEWRVLKWEANED